MKQLEGEKFQRQKKYGKRHKHGLHLKHLAGRNRHHLQPRSRGGKDTINNLLLIDIEKHEYWHALWGNKTAEEVLMLLMRVVQAKDKQTS